MFLAQRRFEHVKEGCCLGVPVGHRCRSGTGDYRGIAPVAVVHLNLGAEQLGPLLSSMEEGRK
jgi:hypothetical protein